MTVKRHRRHRLENDDVGYSEVQHTMQEQGSGRGICHSAIAFTMDLNRIWGELKGDSRLN